MSDAPLRKCPECGGRLERLVSSGAFILKGSGWYKTDYAGKGNGNGRGNSRKDAPSCPAASKDKDAPPACAGCPKAD